MSRRDLTFINEELEYVAPSSFTFANSRHKILTLFLEEYSSKYGALQIHYEISQCAFYVGGKMFQRLPLVF